MLDPANEARLQEILGSFEKTRDTVLAAQKSLQDTSHTFRSADKSLSATVDAQGQLSEVTFHNTKYRQLSPNELGKLVLETVSQAHEQARSQALAALQPVLTVNDGAEGAPGGINPWDMLPGGMGGANGELMQMIRGGLQEALSGLAPGATGVPAAAGPASNGRPTRKPKPRPGPAKSSASRRQVSLDDGEE
ncbi:YbaB/EbfC family nucleoid-associated protein [Streptomyces sp. NPDC005125]